MGVPTVGACRKYHPHPNPPPSRGRELFGTLEEGMIKRRMGMAGCACLLAAFAVCPAPATAQEPRRQAESRDMRLVGYNDLQARSAYHPVIIRQGERWIAYVGHHGGQAGN